MYTETRAEWPIPNLNHVKNPRSVANDLNSIVSSPTWEDRLLWELQATQNQPQNQDHSAITAPRHLPLQEQARIKWS